MEVDCHVIMRRHRGGDGRMFVAMSSHDDVVVDGTVLMCGHGLSRGGLG